MNKQVVLSKEQMTHLEELGLDTSDASMCYVSGCLIIITDLEEIRSWNRQEQPAYILQDILEKLPNELNLQVNNGEDWDSFNKNLQYNFNDNEWCCFYQALMSDDVISFHNSSPLEAAYHMLLWCIENGYIKTK